MRRLALVLIVLFSRELVARPAGPFAYDGPDDTNGASGLEARKQATRLQTDDLKLQHQATYFSAFGFQRFDDTTAGLSLSAANQGRYDITDAASEGPNDMIGLGTGVFLRQRLANWSDFEFSAGLGYDVLAERGKTGDVTTTAFARDASITAGVKHLGLGVVKPFAALDYSRYWGSFKTKGRKEDLSGTTAGQSPWTLEAGVYAEWTKLAIGLVAFTGNQKGFGLSFFSTPRHQDKAPLEQGSEQK